MAFFKKTKYVDLWSDALLLYRGRWNDLPVEENLLLQKSVEFFDDPDPCFIHRDAVRIRLLAELEEGLKDSIREGNPDSGWLKMLSEYTGIGPVSRICFSEKKQENK